MFFDSFDRESQSSSQEQILDFMNKLRKDPRFQ